MNSTIELLVLSSIKSIGAKTIMKVARHIKKKETDLDLMTIDWARMGRLNVVTAKQSQTIATTLNTSYDELRANTTKKISDWSAIGVSVITYLDDDYPQSLLYIEDAPPILYCKGNHSLLSSQSVAIVGARECTDAGATIANTTTEYFANNGFTIVSGLAIGIDEVAHRKAVAIKKPTIAVLVDVEKVQPTSNKTLAKEILDDGGLLISENAPNVRISKGHFVSRDKIQAYISNAVFVIESLKDGGSLHAARAGLSVQLPVYVPDASNPLYASPVPQMEGLEQLKAIDAKSFTEEDLDTIKEAIAG